jgi:glycosyltransferase involved in cell wall biosynthesis
LVTARSLYLCYASLTDPLIRTQVVAYLVGLAKRGHVVHLLTFEPKLDRRARRVLRAEMTSRGISWHHLRYHKRPSLPATVYDTLLGAAFACWLVVRYRLGLIHARSHVPVAMGLLARVATRRRLIFDIRGLLAEEYVDAGRWVRGGAPYRITTWIQEVALRRADGFVVLTERVRRQLFAQAPERRVRVIPCCADFDRLAPTDLDVRGDLDIQDRPIMLYVGKLTGVYMDSEMAGFFAAARQQRPDLLFLVLTQSPPDSIVWALQRANVPPSAYRVTSAPSSTVGDYLAASTFAICFCHPKPSLIASSPTKIGEYLAAGLPVVSGPDVGDTDTILLNERIGAVVERFTVEEYARAARDILAMSNDPGTRQRSRAAAHRIFSLDEVGIPRYDGLYREMTALSRP